jgi:hypothetical protein
LPSAVSWSAVKLMRCVDGSVVSIGSPHPHPWVDPYPHGRSSI